MAPIRLAVLLSGGGTTLQNFSDLIGDGLLDARIVQVVSSREEAYGVERARRASLPVAVAARKQFPDAARYSEHIFDLIRAAQADLVLMAGFLQFLPIAADYRLRVMNIHPALLPAFGGKGMYGHHVHEAVLAYGAKVSGCTVHFADDEYDHGPVILQRVIPVLENDTPESLAFRVFEAERVAYPDAVRLYADGRLQIDGRRVRILGDSRPGEPPIDDER